MLIFRFNWKALFEKYLSCFIYLFQVGENKYKKNNKNVWVKMINSGFWCFVGFIPFQDKKGKRTNLTEEKKYLNE